MTDTQAFTDAWTGKVLIHAGDNEGEVIGDTGLIWDSQSDTFAPFAATFTEAADGVLAAAGWTRTSPWAETIAPGFGAHVVRNADSGGGSKGN